MPPRRFEASCDPPTNATAVGDQRLQDQEQKRRDEQELEAVLASERERLLAAADALVICSAREGLPRAAVQARIAGIPVVSTALPQIGSVVTDGKTGYLVPLDQLDAMKAAFDQLMKNPDLRTALRGGQPPFDSQAWRTETMTAQIADAYRTVDLARSQRGRTTKA